MRIALTGDGGMLYRRKTTLRETGLILLLSMFCVLPSGLAAEPEDANLQRHPHPVSRRPLGSGPTLFVDVARGNDANSGTEKDPWQTVGYALTRLTAGQTLCLREGTYYENVVISLAGRADAPVTVRAYPGERAIVDGGIAEFFRTPADAWVPFPDGGGGVPRAGGA